MEVKKTKALKNGKFIGLVIKEKLDISSLVKNALLYILYDNCEPVSFCTVKEWKTCLELGTVVTPKKLRKKGYSSRLLMEVLKNYDKIYLICEKDLENFYNRFDFEKVENLPSPISIRKDLANLFSDKYIAMMR